MTREELIELLEECHEAFYLIWIQNENFPEDGAKERDRISYEMKEKLFPIVERLTNEKPEKPGKRK